MKEPGKNEAFVSQARELFDDSVERLDAATLSRLNQGRHRALAELETAKPLGQWLRWAPAAGIAAAAVVAVMIMNGPAPTMTDEPITASDFEMLLEDDSLELLEDLEFYTWLQSADLEANDNVG
jgi:hypothetical protein